MSFTNYISVITKCHFEYLNYLAVDNQPPVVRCPANVQLTILTGMGGSTVEWDEATAIDNSGTANLVSRTHNPGSFFPIGETSVTYTFSDPSGNQGRCTFNIIIVEGKSLFYFLKDVPIYIRQTQLHDVLVVKLHVETLFCVCVCVCVWGGVGVCMCVCVWTYIHIHVWEILSTLM